MGLIARLEADWLVRRKHGRFYRSIEIGAAGAMLGAGTCLAPMRSAGARARRLDLSGEDRILALLAATLERPINPRFLVKLGRASALWAEGEKCLAHIHLIQCGLPALESEEQAFRLFLADGLIAEGYPPAALGKALGFDLPRGLRKYSPDQPRDDHGRWTAGAGSSGGSGGFSLSYADDSGDPAEAADAVGASNEAPQVEGRSAGGVDHIERDLPKDAIAVTRPDGSTIDDPDSPTGKLMAPPRANFQEVYAAGERIANWPLMAQHDPGKAALQQFGTYDFQRDKTTNTFFKEYVPAANYAIGVYMAGAGYPLTETYAIAQWYAMGNSSNWYNYWTRGRAWIKSGWDDATAGYWKTK